MKKINKEDIIKISKTVFERFSTHLWKTLNRTGTILLFFLFISSIFGTLIFYEYILRPTRDDFYHEDGLIEIDTTSYFSVREIWNKRAERLSEIDDREFDDPFFPIETTIIDLPDIEFPEEDISTEDLEELLVRTLFEFYGTRGEGMPPISERALIWEELGLGTAGEYQGLYHQNIILLGTLKEIMNDDQS